uniref:Uncharacterized protein n=1 Tax=Setaria italica TaxID=4555 RepID=K3Z218_SETIT
MLEHSQLAYMLAKVANSSPAKLPLTFGNGISISPCSV